MTEAGFRVTGRVQGVGFRWWTRSRATRLGLSGTVRNEPDGSVVVHARGPDDAVQALREWLAHGPPGARVDDLADLPYSADGSDEGEFVILR